MARTYDDIGEPLQRFIAEQELDRYKREANAFSIDGLPAWEG